VLKLTFSPYKVDHIHTLQDPSNSAQFLGKTQPIFFKSCSIVVLLRNKEMACNRNFLSTSKPETIVKYSRGHVASVLNLTFSPHKVDHVHSLQDPSNSAQFLGKNNPFF
jgi:hypothetical protein